jgi:hypothetical protein
MQKELRAMLGASNENHKDDPQHRDEIELMRRRMLRELERFLSKSINRPFPRLRLLLPSPPRRNRATISLN